ncbi:hypothetical protein D9M71_674390 [compost metagenome]
MATAPRVKTSASTCAPCATSRSSCRARVGRRCWRCVARCTCPRPDSSASTGRRSRPAARPSPTRATPLPAACASWTRRSPPAARWNSAATASARSRRRLRTAISAPWSSSRPGACRSAASCAMPPAWLNAWSTTATSAHGATTCLTRSMAWCSRSTASPPSASWASGPVSRAGRLPTSSRPWKS